MIQAFKTWKLAGALKAKGNAPEAYSAVLELGRVGGDKAVELLVETLNRRDGVARAAARELGRLGDARAVEPLVKLLADSHVSQSAAEALLALGAKSVEALIPVLKSEHAGARLHAATTLGEIRDKRAGEALITVLETDEYSVRTAAATALGQLKDGRAVWVMVGTLKMRDETTPERQALLEKLRQATALALHKIGDPLAAKGGVTAAASAEAALRQAEENLRGANTHPRLIGELKLLTEAELVGVLKELVAAIEEISWAGLENREPMLAGYFKSYEQRSQIAELLGQELHQRGGKALLQRVLSRDLGGHATITNWWDALLR
jgi:HEAT repeat protein